jgi:hypothetical protein
MPLALGRLFIACTLVFSLFEQQPSQARPPCGTDTTISGDRDITSSLPCRRTRSALLNYVGTVTVPGADSFSAATHFREGPALITWIGDNFRERFLPKVEFNISAAVLDVFRLRRSALDPEIRSELGGYPEVSLHDIWILLLWQSRGQTGPLLTNATPNIFYVRDVSGKVWAVDAVWGGAGWEIGASSLDDPRLWRHGRQVIAR